MNEIIKVENNTALLDITIANQIAEFEELAKQIKEKEDELKKLILNEMELKNIKKINMDFLTITYIDPSDRETFDTKSFREEHPELYDEYVKMSPVKSSIRIKVQ